MTQCTVMLSVRFSGESVANEIFEILQGEPAGMAPSGAVTVPQGYSFDEWISGATPAADAADDEGELLLSFTCGARDGLLETLMAMLREYVDGASAHGAG